ncbi:hypothetical protein CDEF62S_03802 [Castellaniella defragrans]|uniref:Uncharacterized protein n=1 Tax=Eoetvoesiella caeni TaxID=645616 RepID=A0A366H791_9BURK|nr:hypothetical protein DFR37_110101 [Eoetvoesiella caeni]
MPHQLTTLEGDAYTSGASSLSTTCIMTEMKGID